MFRISENFLYRASLHNFPLIQYHHFLSDFGHHAQVMGNKNHAHAVLLLQTAYQFQYILLHCNIQSRGRLIGNQNIRIATHSVVHCSYPDNDFSYHQDDATTLFNWDFDLEEFELPGSNVMDYYFTPGRGYDVAISAKDINQCPTLVPITFRVRTSKNPIRNIMPQAPLCTGDEFNLSVGYSNMTALQLSPVGSEQITSLAVVDTVFLPDGISCPPYGYYYRSYVNFTAFAPNATITSANDILYVRLKIEHSAIEDIRISLVCPNGNRCKIVPDYQYDGWGGVTHYFRTNLGVANRLQEVVSCNASQNPLSWNKTNYCRYSIRWEIRELISWSIPNNGLTIKKELFC